MNSLFAFVTDINADKVFFLTNKNKFSNSLLNLYGFRMPKSTCLKTRYLYVCMSILFHKITMEIVVFSSTLCVVHVYTHPEEDPAHWFWNCILYLGEFGCNPCQADVDGLSAMENIIPIWVFACQFGWLLSFTVDKTHLLCLRS